MLTFLWRVPYMYTHMSVRLHLSITVYSFTFTGIKYTVMETMLKNCVRNHCLRLRDTAFY